VIAFPLGLSQKTSYVTVTVNQTDSFLSPTLTLILDNSKKYGSISTKHG
jgi:hypothetical protein